MLNAKNHEHEAQIIQEAGQRSAVTIATNMAGRGVDIKLGEGIRELGGLYIVGTERHESRRIDNQLRGRSGRQGDPGETRFFLSAEDDLVRLFAGDRIYTILDKLGPGEGEPIEHGMLTKRIEGAQKRVEEQNFDIRKNVLKYDDVLNKQRTVIYEERREVLEGADLDETVLEWIDEVVERAVEAHTETQYAEEWDLDGMFVELHSIYPVSFTAADLGDLSLGEVDREDLIDRVVADARRHYEQKDVLLEERFTGWIAALCQAALAPKPDQAQLAQLFAGLPIPIEPDVLPSFEGLDRDAVAERLIELAREQGYPGEFQRQIERYVLLEHIDRHWREHLDEMDYLREGIHLRGMAQKDPLVEYRVEGHSMFEQMRDQVKVSVVSVLLHADIEFGQPEEMPPPQQMPSGNGHLVEQQLLEAENGDEATTYTQARTGGTSSSTPLSRGPRRLDDSSTVPGGPASRRERDRAQRPVLVRLGQEVQALPRRRSGVGRHG